jgi:mono/diheme cytochrome c family protein
MPAVPAFPVKQAFVAAGLTLALAACGSQAEPQKGVAQDNVKRGEYLVTIMSCADCHTPGYFFGKPDETRKLAGGDVGFFIPELGYFYGRNLTPDRQTGLGDWTDEEVVTAMRTGVRPDGRVLSPNMPWQAFAKLSDDDANAIVAYLRTLKPVSNVVPPPAGPHEKAPGPFLAVTMPASTVHTAGAAGK